MIVGFRLKRMMDRSFRSIDLQEVEFRTICSRIRQRMNEWSELESKSNPFSTRFFTIITFRWVNGQDFSRASPEPPLPSDTTRADQQTPQDLYNALQKHMQPITMLHHGAAVHPFLSKVKHPPLLLSKHTFSRIIGQL